MERKSRSLILEKVINLSPYIYFFMIIIASKITNSLYRDIIIYNFFFVKSVNAARFIYKKKFF